jgi:hypothetical protein
MLSLNAGRKFRTQGDHDSRHGAGPKRNNNALAYRQRSSKGWGDQVGKGATEASRHDDIGIQREGIAPRGVVDQTHRCGHAAL